MGLVCELALGLWALPLLLPVVEESSKVSSAVFVSFHKTPFSILLLFFSGASLFVGMILLVSSSCFLVLLVKDVLGLFVLNSSLSVSLLMFVGAFRVETGV